jgi:hypothetical protein
MYNYYYIILELRFNVYPRKYKNKKVQSNKFQNLLLCTFFFLLSTIFYQIKALSLTGLNNLSFSVILNAL